MEGRVLPSYGLAVVQESKHRSSQANGPISPENCPADAISLPLLVEPICETRYKDGEVVWRSHGTWKEFVYDEYGCHRR